MIVARRSLPQSLGAVRLPSGPLDVEAARRRLGGGVAAQPRMGERVRGVDTRGIEHRGVLLCLEDGLADVWIGGGRILRTAEGLVPDASEHDEGGALGDIVRRARRFAALQPGAALSWRAPDDSELSGVVREKCRYGALVETPAGAILAVSFTLLG